MRDTDDDWRRIGATEPYFGVLTHESYRSENLTPDALDAFYESGRLEIRRMLTHIGHFGPFKPASAIDFGCGVGRLTRALAEKVDRVYGVDVSEPMLEIARADAPPGAHYAVDLPDTLVDWVVSLIVFQHIPPARGYALFEQLLARLAPGGWMSVQFTLYRDERQIIGPASQIRSGFWDGTEFRIFANVQESGATAIDDMVMHDYDLTRLYAIANNAGIGAVLLMATDHGGHHGAYLYGQKSA